MPRRRTFLMSLAALAGLVVPFPARAAVPVPAPMPAVRRYGRMYVVNGWILTAADVEALQRHL